MQHFAVYVFALSFREESNIFLSEFILINYYIITNV